MAITQEAATQRAEDLERRRQEKREASAQRWQARRERVENYLRTAPGRFWDWQNRVGENFRIARDTRIIQATEAAKDKAAEVGSALRRSAEDAVVGAVTGGVILTIEGYRAVSYAKEKYAELEAKAIEKKDAVVAKARSAWEGAKAMWTGTKDATVSAYETTVSTAQRLPGQTRDLAKSTWTNVSAGTYEVVGNIISGGANALTSGSEALRQLSSHVQERRAAAANLTTVQQQIQERLAQL